MQSSDRSLASHDSNIDVADPDLVGTSPSEPSSNGDMSVEADETKCQSLQAAIEEDDVEKLETLLVSDPELLHATLYCDMTEDSETTTLAVTPLAFAVACQRIPSVELFLQHEEAVNEPIPTAGWSALHLAARYDFQDSLNLLLASHAKIDQPDADEMTPLHLACRYDRIQVVQLLLDAGADLYVRNDEGCTPFHVACMYGQLEIVELLWEKGPKSQISDENSHSNQALQLAVINDRLNVVLWLLQHGAYMPQQVGKDGKTALHFACAKGLFDMVSLLLEQGADIHQKDAHSNTPLLQSCWDPQPDIFSFLHSQGALVSDVNKHGRNGFHAVVLGDGPFTEAHKDVLNLLVGSGADINRRDIFGYSPLFHACRERKTELIEFLLDLGADIEQKTSHNGLTALMEACCSPSKEPVEILLRKGAKLTPINPHGLTALALACVHGCLDHVDALMNKGVDIAARDREGHTPLCTAADHGQTEIMLRILESPRYYPPYPADPISSKDQGIFTANERHDTEIEGHLIHAVEQKLYGTSETLYAIMYWAVAHGRIDLARQCISSDSEALKWRRGEATWLHVAARHTQPQLINELLSDIDASTKASGKVSALHLAAGSGSLETVSGLLEMIGAQYQDQSLKTRRTTAASLERDSRGASPLTASIHRRQDNITELFWAEIQAFGTSDRSFMRRHPNQAALILETLAQYEKPGNEITLKHLLEQWCPNSPFPNDRGAPVVWWLLSKEGYSSDRAINNARQLVQYSEDAGIRKILDELLQNPLPVLNNIANPNDDPLPELPIPTDTNDPALKLQGTIVEIYSDGTIRSTHDPNPTSESIIYGSGPDKIMEDSADLDHWHLNALKSKIRESRLASNCAQRLSSASGPDITRSNCGDDQRPPNRLDRNLQLRWIHLPVNKLHFMRDLIIRLSYDSKRSAMDHRVLMRHFNRSWTDLAAGGGQRYMKPQCVRDGGTSSKRDSNAMPQTHTPCTALYMPYLTLGCYQPRGDCDPNTENWAQHDEPVISHRSRPTTQQPITLDQYYYPTLIDTDSRDKDQVLSKYLEWKAGEVGHRNHQEQRSTGGTSTSPTDQAVGKHPTSILIVDQIWMWIIDEKTIITTSTETTGRNEKSKESLLQTVLDNMIYGEKKGTFERPTSVHSMMELILGVATGFFARKFVPLSNNPSGVFKTPLEVFRESLRHAADKEIFLYQTFLRELNGRNQRRQREDEFPTTHTIKNITSHPYGSQSDPDSISPEAEVLDTIRDIRDELHMLKSLVEDQEVVWKQAFDNHELKDCFQYYQPCTPIDVKKDLDDMLVEVEMINDSINTLLDLRQKQASIRQANDTAKQSNTIFVFTVITIIFLPLSFLSSMFALDVSSFPHESGDLKYKGWWLFSILFGASAVVSLPAIFLAWKVNDISEWFRLGRNRGSKRIDHLDRDDHANHDEKAEEPTEQGLQNLAKRILHRRRKDSPTPQGCSEKV
ncbi:hypothetical protein NM208_g9933 [Fusarium decemcellulare]|uniref:Uncharacterized protein n=1 Tax=Fusarium decemcellulare TaxID=57161 RepID=A0ACC1RZP7_9HYPO|nr:hypothetical protein NM208_g9933 [Fusarium decemcellulare]